MPNRFDARKEIERIRKARDKFEIDYGICSVEIKLKDGFKRTRWKSAIPYIIYLAFIERSAKISWDYMVVVKTKRATYKGTLKSFLHKLDYCDINLFLDYGIIKISPNE